MTKLAQMFKKASDELVALVSSNGLQRRNANDLADRSAPIRAIEHDGQGLLS